VLTPKQRAEVLRLASVNGPRLPEDSDEDLWYAFLSGLYGNGNTLGDLKLSQGHKPEIMAVLRNSPPTGPRQYPKRGERPV